YRHLYTSAGNLASRRTPAQRSVQIVRSLPLTGPLHAFQIVEPHPPYRDGSRNPQCKTEHVHLPSPPIIGLFLLILVSHPPISTTIDTDTICHVYCMCHYFIGIYSACVNIHL